MNAFNNINLAGACLLTSTEFAKELGIPESQWIYPLGGAGTQDSEKCKCKFPGTYLPYVPMLIIMIQSGNGQIIIQAPQSRAL